MPITESGERVRAQAVPRCRGAPQVCGAAHQHCSPRALAVPRIEDEHAAAGALAGLATTLVAVAAADTNALGQRPARLRA